MSEEINDNGLTADAPAMEPEVENPEDNVVPHKVDEQQENVSEAKETKTNAAEKPDWLEDKFWDKENNEIKTEDLNKSFSELQKQFSMGKHKAPKDYHLEVLEDVVAEKQQLGPNADQIVKGTVTWMQGLVAKGIWSETDFEEGKIFTATADGINAINKIRQYYGEQTIPTAPTDVDGQPSREELFALVADPKYKTDPGFRAKVEKQFERAFPGEATSTGQI